MSKESQRIVVAGDVAIDWLQWPLKPKDAAAKGALNWELIPGYRMVPRPGGAMLLACFVGAGTRATVLTHQFEQPIEDIPPHKVLHSQALLDVFSYSSDQKDEKNLIYRVKRLQGFTGPASGTPNSLPLKINPPEADIVVLDDAGNGFRNDEKVWPAALQAKDKPPLVVLKMSRPLAEGRLWDQVTRGCRDRLIVVISANDLRMDGVNISRHLSWERTVTDLVWQMSSHPCLKRFADISHLVVRFRIDGALYRVRGQDRVDSFLYYDPLVAEDDFKEKYPGDMLGFNSAFVAGIVAQVLEKGLPGVGEGVRNGILCARRLLQLGFGKDANLLDYPAAGIFEPSLEEKARKGPVIAEIRIPESAAVDGSSWRILEELRVGQLEGLAYDIVRRGERADLQNVPIGKFGDLKTADRSEIESYRSIKNLIDEYCKTADAKRPLCIAVFGPPGSGKSFGVKQVAESVAPGQVVPLQFNVAEFVSDRDLTKAFHQVHDVGLAGKIALVFFDEFDSTRDVPLGWLKYFLAPTQDGEFRDGETLHPIGKAIFVFAGGTSNSFQAFSRERESDEVKKNEFKDRKGPDFVSRLRGYIDILGPNRMKDEDNLAMIRRAIMLRSVLERKAKQLEQKAKLLDRKEKYLIDANKEALIDPGVLRAFIKVPEYKHGVRSMEAIVDMSMLADHKSFEKAALPPAAQLELHVDAQAFSRLVVRDELFGAAREKLGGAFHERYLKEQQGRKPATDPAMQPWETLREGLKESNRLQADQIPAKLRTVKCDFGPVLNPAAKREAFTPGEVEILAEMEHQRYCDERKDKGWTWGPARDDIKKINPCLVPWGELKEEEKNKDRVAVRCIPELLAEAGFEMYRLK